MPASGNPPILVVDNGAYSAKFGHAGASAPALDIPNCTARSRKDGGRLLIGDETLAVRTHGQLVYNRAHERGVLTDAECQIAVWNRTFGPKLLDIDPAEHLLLATEYALSPPSSQSTFDQVIYEYFGFSSCFRTNAPALAAVYSSVVTPPVVVEAVSSLLFLFDCYPGQSASQSVIPVTACKRVCKAPVEDIED
jgi:actin-related protein